MFTFAWGWVSFVVGGLAIPGALIGGLIAWEQISEAIKGRAYRRWLATTCALCMKTRGEHARDGSCPRLSWHETDRFVARAKGGG